MRLSTLNQQLAQIPIAMSVYWLMLFILKYNESGEYIELLFRIYVGTRIINMGYYIWPRPRQVFMMPSVENDLIIFVISQIWSTSYLFDKLTRFAYNLRLIRWMYP